jgi:transcriptional regulator
MYIPESFRVTDETLVFSFIERYDFAALITSTPTAGGLVTHLPLFLQHSGEHAVLLGHVSRANQQWQHFDGSTKSLAIFRGPHTYVSPHWYQSSPAVPTWNYAVVHVHGCPRAVEDRHHTAAILDHLLAKYEGHRSQPWHLRDLSPDYYEHMVQQIVGFEMPIDQIEAKFKLGQNRSRTDREGTMNGLLEEGTADSAALAAFMQASADI